MKTVPCDYCGQEMPDTTKEWIELFGAQYVIDSEKEREKYGQDGHMCDACYGAMIAHRRIGRG